MRERSDVRRNYSARTRKSGSPVRPRPGGGRPESRSIFEPDLGPYLVLIYRKRPIWPTCITLTWR